MICDIKHGITSESRGKKITLEISFVILAVLLLTTFAASFEYYRQVRRAQREYLKAKNALSDIILSFRRELKREGEKLEITAFKIEGNSAKIDVSLEKVGAIEKRLVPIESQITAISQIKASVTNDMTTLLSGLTGLEAKLKDIEATQDILQVKINDFEGQIQKLAMLPSDFKTEPVIPIRRDKALAALTDTETIVLEFLSNEGSKTAPEIRDKVQLSREHTARLMKKLYEEGYLEREVGKIPFRYSIKSEMEKILRKAEGSSST